MTIQQFVSYRKMGGWLRVFQVLAILSVVFSGLGIISILFTSQLSIQMGLLTPSYLVFTIITGIIGMVLSLAQLVLLAKRNTKLPLVYLISGIVGLIISAITPFIPMMDIAKVTNYAKSYNINPDLLTSSMQVGATPSIIFGMFTSVALLVAWMVYFKRSQRYRVYFLSTQQYNQEYIAHRQYWEQQMAQMQGQPGGMPMPGQPAYPQQPPVQQPYNQPPVQQYGQPAAPPQAPQPPASPVVEPAAQPAASVPQVPAQPQTPAEPPQNQ
ncbi:DUF2569 domain-containing protein [Ruminococcaceae bacterium OttesenSCG-928-A16]|nr:DUF2569 domain-containing protein [Ruminococcaceae bacterium OttesenSCG-928-A16]